MKGTSLLVRTCLESNCDGVISECLWRFVSLLEQEDQRFALGHAVDIVVGEGLKVAVEVVGLNDRLVLGGGLVASRLL